MVRAILSGQKTVTRRVIKPFQVPTLDDDGRWYSVAQRHPKWGFAVDGDTERECANALAGSLCCPYGKPGDWLWVRESTESYLGLSPCKAVELSRYCADRESVLKTMDVAGTNIEVVDHWQYHRRVRPSIHMPRSQCRILLEITAVRIERVQDISDDQARAEGVAEWAKGALSPDGCAEICRQEAFRMLWESINGAGSWNANPWVWVVEFKRVAA
ncbi:hypothetical protein ACP3VQ_13355 [Metapseudomonas otitidis]|uniref:hypothetical protein n=1 Tax=Metapseudomonas otitidis TaxID=319939 RepID=UPI003CE70172